MCGIAGVIRFGHKPIDPEALAVLLVGNEHRGNDATGIAVVQPDGAVAVHKEDIPAWKFVSTKAYETFLADNLKPDTWAVLLHTRAATQGNPRENKNNHPLSVGKAAIIHNGMISNDHTLFNAMELERGAETDSDIIRAIVDEHGITPKAMETLNRMAGSAAGAAVHPDYPKKVLLFRSGSPMTLASTQDFLFFASEKNTIHRAMRPWVKRFGTWFQRSRPEIDFAPMANHTIWLIDETGVSAHKEFKTSYASYTEPHRRTYEDYKERRNRWDRAKKYASESKPTPIRVLRSANPNDMEDAWCPTCQRTWVIPKGKSPINFVCDAKDNGCGRTLTLKPVSVH